MSVLDVLGCRYGTEKASNWPGRKHNYLPFYEQFLRPLRDKKITLLEIGVDKGNSLRMWRDYFQRGKIVGMDNQDLKHLAGPRIEIELGDQNSIEDLTRIAAAHGPFDVIVDDAGHWPPSQKFCHSFMLKHLKPGGFYILEDLVGLDGPFADSTCTDYLRDLGNDTMRSEIPLIESVAFSYGTFRHKDKRLMAITHKRLLNCLDYNPDTGIFTWLNGAVAGGLNTDGYCRIAVDKQRHAAHRLAWFYVYKKWPISIIDHINGCKDDNRIVNLRLANHCLNRVNSKVNSNSVSGIKGICWSHRVKKWKVSIQKDGRLHHLGYYANKEQAILVRRLTAHELYGEFANG